MSLGHGHREARGWSECLAAAVLFGATTPLLKLATPKSSPLWSAGLLYVGAALAVAPLQMPVRVERSSSRTIGFAALAIFLGGCAAPVLLLFALRAAGAADVSLWLGLEAVFTALIAQAFFRERLSAKAWAASGLVVLAGGLVAGVRGAGFVPALLVAVACLCWAIDNNLSASLSEISPRRFVLLKGVVAGSVNAAAALAIGHPPPGLLVAFAIVVIGAVGYGVSLVLYLRGARQLGAARSQLIFGFAPLAGIALSWALLGEPMTAVELLAVGIFLGGLWFLWSEKHAHAHLHETVVHSHEHRHDDGHHLHTHPGLPPETAHTHEHAHERLAHAHPHAPDVHHRHPHPG